MPDKSEARRFSRLFDAIYAEGAYAGGIIKARRENTAKPWDREGEERRSAQYMEQYIDDADEAVSALAEGRRRRR